MLKTSFEIMQISGSEEPIDTLTVNELCPEIQLITV